MEYVKADAPDLQCKSTMSGVEVTIATLNMEAAIKAIELHIDNQEKSIAMQLEM